MNSRKTRKDLGVKSSHPMMTSALTKVNVVKFTSHLVASFIPPYNIAASGALEVARMHLWALKIVLPTRKEISAVASESSKALYLESAPEGSPTSMAVDRRVHETISRPRHTLTPQHSKHWLRE